MPEEQFKLAHESASVVELSESRTVYKLYNYTSGTNYKFYYFKSGKLRLMDEGFVPYGTQSVVATSESR